MRYTVVLVPDPEQGGFVAYVPAIPDCVTQGETVEDAHRMARDAADAMLAVAADHNEDLPTEPDGIVIGPIQVKVPELAGTTA